MRPFAVSVALVAALSLSALADDTVEIKPPVLKAGDKFKVTKTEKTKSTEAFEFGGKASSKDKEDSRLIVYTEQVVTAGADGEKPAKVVRVYEKYDVTSAKDGPPPLNTPITIAKKGDKFEFTADKPIGEFATALEREFNKPNEPSTKDFLPGKPVKSGDSWKIDPTKFVKSLGQDKLNVDAEKSVMTGRLLKTYKKDGKLFGVLELSATFPLKDLGKEGVTLKSGTIKMTVNTDVCIDGTDNSENTKSVLGFDVAAEAMGVKVTVKSDGVQSTTKELVPRK
ncbi:hypothetical protein GobsT_32000 [Gemmata obscuriglobus]|uniref:DUF5666 domain-containing protein n=1 Tax=Gemmata obscuriglobus TaxID=114 RepID=A0A2Z3H194_9BACT|nr:hypothetical protein [Gemmata obscuriglobus]AWM38621.1 hypothetical protein C1280_17600 [Gemmata obscuriglobus]QEG28421.1 hypothetical protein GobsT_32000 [Gemmata obscuriglobus]VTS06379.1 unnamed protein product [Gemmata obscuriglobus UQM 2246]